MTNTRWTANEPPPPRDNRPVDMQKLLASNARIRAAWDGRDNEFYCGLAISEEGVE